MKAIQLIPTIVIGLVVAGLVATAGVKVIANFRSNVVAGLDSTAVVNESQTVGASNTITPTYVSTGGILTTLTNVYINESATQVEITIGAEANASTGYHGTGQITLAGNYTSWGTNISYSYSTFSDELNATINAMSGTTEMSNQFSTIGIIAAMVVILMMIGGLTAYFGLR